MEALMPNLEIKALFCTAEGTFTPLLYLYPESSGSVDVHGRAHVIGVRIGLRFGFVEHHIYAGHCRSVGWMVPFRERERITIDPTVFSVAAFL